MLVQLSVLTISTLATYGLLRLRHFFRKRRIEAMSDQELKQALGQNQISVYDIPALKRIELQDPSQKAGHNKHDHSMELQGVCDQV